jgi:uncharacterized protein YprB with RNaseH-like and TPR domain
MPLDSSRLASRIRDVVRGGRRAPSTSDEVRPLDQHDVPDGPGSGPRYVIDPDADAVWSAPGGCAVVERHYDVDFWHGRQSVRDYFETLEQGRRWFSVLGARGQARVAGQPRVGFDWDDETGPTEIERPAAPRPSGPLLFFDLETTGLSGGAGTVAFLAGCGHFDADGFHTKQFFLSGYEAEHDLLVSLGVLLKDYGGLVTFNGRAFDVPLIETRYLFHRLDSPFDGFPHFDMLHPARRLWRRRSSRFGEPDTWAPSAAADNESCALGVLEEAILGVRREGDVPGSEIPSRYFHYLRTGDGSGLEAVFEHNRLDVLSLAAITSVAARMVEQGPSGAPTPREALALGQVFERAGQGESAVACYGRAAGLGDAPWESRSIETGLRAEALRRLAVMHRRQRRYGDAAEAWNHLVEMEASHVYRAEAIRALAIHHEHRAKDLGRARNYAERALEVEHEPGEADALRHRLSRLDRKLQQRGQR